MSETAEPPIQQPVKTSYNIEYHGPTEYRNNQISGTSYRFEPAFEGSDTEVLRVVDGAGGEEKIMFEINTEKFISIKEAPR